jgi:hypothetical protein
VISIRELYSSLLVHPEFAEKPLNEPADEELPKTERKKNRRDELDLESVCERAGHSPYLGMRKHINFELADIS